MSTWWSRILPWRRERPVPYTPREPAAVADWSDIAVAEEDRKALGEAFRRARASSTAHNAPPVADEKGVTRLACRYCPDPLCPEDCPECGGPIHDLDAVPAQQRDAHPEEQQPMATVSPGIGEIQVTRQRGRGVIVDHAPARALLGLRIIRDLAWPANIAEVGDPDLVNIADQVLYRVVGYDAGTASLIVELVEDWRPALAKPLTETEAEEIRSRWQERYSKPGTCNHEPTGGTP